MLDSKLFETTQIQKLKQKLQCKIDLHKRIAV